MNRLAIQGAYAMATAKPAKKEGNWPRLVADVGGTNARFALEVSPQELEHIETLPTSDYDSLHAAIRTYLEKAGQPNIKHAAIAIANPVVGDWVQMTNHHWAFSIETTRQALELDTLIVLNDFTAQALSIPHLPKRELLQVGGASPVDDTPIAVIGPGTGLGVSGLIPNGKNGYTALAGEGGTSASAPSTIPKSTSGSTPTASTVTYRPNASCPAPACR